MVQGTGLILNKHSSQIRQNCFQYSLALLCCGNHTSLKALAATSPKMNLLQVSFVMSCSCNRNQRFQQTLRSASVRVIKGASQYIAIHVLFRTTGSQIQKELHPLHSNFIYDLILAEKRKWSVTRLVFFYTQIIMI